MHDDCGAVDLRQSIDRAVQALAMGTARMLVVRYASIACRSRSRSTGSTPTPSELIGWTSSRSVSRSLNRFTLRIALATTVTVIRWSQVESAASPRKRDN